MCIIHIYVYIYIYYTSTINPPIVVQSHHLPMFSDRRCCDAADELELQRWNGSSRMADFAAK